MPKHIDADELIKYCEKVADTSGSLYSTVLDRIGHGEIETSAIGAMAYFMQQEAMYRREIPNVVNSFIKERKRVVDTAEVTRCKYCYKRNTAWCPMGDWMGPDDSFFCSYGKRKDIAT